MGCFAHSYRWRGKYLSFPSALPPVNLNESSVAHFKWHCCFLGAGWDFPPTRCWLMGEMCLAEALAPGEQLSQCSLPATYWQWIKETLSRLPVTELTTAPRNFEQWEDTLPQSQPHLEADVCLFSGLWWCPSTHASCVCGPLGTVLLAILIAQCDRGVCGLIFAEIDGCLPSLVNIFC